MRKPTPATQSLSRRAKFVLLSGVLFLTPHLTSAQSVNDKPFVGDIDGDARADHIMWIAATATFRWVTSSSGYGDGAAASKQWGASSDVPLVGDLDGDGKSDLIVWRPGTATFHWLLSSTGYSYSAQGSRQWGATDQPDVPLVSDIDGDNKADLVVWRRSTGSFYWLTSSSAYSYAAQGSRQWGGVVSGVVDIPLLEDADGDGRADLFYWRPRTATFHWLTSSTGYSATAAGSRQWGAADQPDVPMLPDIDGDGRADLAVWRRGTGTFYWLTSSSGYSYAAQGAKQWGGVANGVPDVPLTGDVDGDNKADLIVVRPATGAFQWVTSSTGYSSAAAGSYSPGSSGGGTPTQPTPPTTPTPPASSCSGVSVPLSTSNLPTFVNGYPEGTTFCFQTGTYRLTGSIMAKSRTRFIGQPGTVLDGQNSVSRGIWGYGGASGQQDVLVQGLTLVNFTGTAVQMGWRWTIQRSEIYQSQIGVEVNSYGTLDGNYLHDNRQYGLSGGPVTDILLVNNEIARNNKSYCGGACAGDAGGSKIIGTRTGTYNVTWRNNYVHDNMGPGIWSDGNVRNVLYEGNTISRNSASGLQHELSWEAVIRNNTITDNDSENIGRSCWWGANILINTSPNVEVYGNTITGNNGSNGICAVSSDRADAAPFPTVTTNFYAHDNIIYMTGSASSGLVKGSASGVVNNRFLANTYRVTNTTRAWWTWPTVVSATWSTWRGTAGQDAGGTLASW